MAEKNKSPENNENVEFSVTNILQSHDILISILLGKILADTANPQDMANMIREMVNMQDVSKEVKNYIELLLAPIEEAILSEVALENEEKASNAEEGQ